MNSAFRWKKEDKNWILYFLEELLTTYPNQLTIGMDMAKNAYWKSYGGKPGLNYLIETISGFLKEKGLEEYEQKLFFDNPQKLYAFIEKQMKNPFKI